MVSITKILPLAAVAVLSLSGCLEKPPEVVLHEPGQYKGAQDPLLAVAGSDASNEALAERFKNIQTDR